MRGKKERARSGRLPQATGKGCYGYTYVPETGRHVLNPEQAPIVVRIFEEFVGGKGGSRIADELNADGIPTFTGKRWYPATVHHVLRNETYTGHTVFGKTGARMVRRPGRKRRVREVYARPESEHIEIEGASPPIVSNKLFERAQARLDDPERHAQHKPSRTYPLRGRLRCHCGSAMTGHAVNRGLYSYYRCNRLYLSAEDERCASRMVRTEVLESAVRQTLSELLADPAMVLEMAEALRFDSGNGARLAEVERNLRKLGEDESRLADLYIDGKMKKPLLDEKGAALATRRAPLPRAGAPARGSGAGLRPRGVARAHAGGAGVHQRVGAESRRGRVGAARSGTRGAHRGRAWRGSDQGRGARDRAGKGGKIATIEQTSVSVFRTDKIERVPLVVTASLPRGRGRGRA